MKTEFNLAAASMLAAILSVVSMSAYAQSVEISAELGGTVPIDGVWSFPDCDPTDPPDPGEFDTQEYLIFTGNEVESREVEYESDDGTCSGPETIVYSETFPFDSVGDPLESWGWAEIEDDGTVTPLLPPLRQDGNGSLETVPIVTKWAADLGGVIEIGYFYIDNTGDTWYLYRNAGEDDAPTLYMSPEEPLHKVDIVLEPVPECEIELTQEVYVDGDTITTEVFRVSNPTGERLPLEVKAWMDRPDGSVKSVFNLGAYGFFRVWPEMDVDLGPLWLGRVHSRKPRGEYELGCRILDPKTGALLAEDRASFEIQ